MLPDLNRIKVFYYIYAKKSIVSAAKDLFITQSAISQHLRKLEEELGAKLFTRLHRKLIPTEAGEQLFFIVEPFIRDLENSVRSIKSSREKPAGRLRIGAPVEFGQKYLPAIAASFRKQYPDVSFYLDFGGPGGLFSRLDEGLIDFAYIDILSQKKFNKGEPHIFSIEPVISEHIVMACSKQYYDTHIRGNHDYNHLIKQDFIAYQRHDYTLISWFSHHFDKSISQLSISMVVDNHFAIISGIKNHMGLGVVASHSIWDEINSKQIIPITTGTSDIINHISLVQHQDKVRNTTEKVFQKHCIEQIRSNPVMKFFSRVPRVI